MKDQVYWLLVYAHIPYTLEDLFYLNSLLFLLKEFLFIDKRFLSPPNFLSCYKQVLQDSQSAYQTPSLSQVLQVGLGTYSREMARQVRATANDLNLEALITNNYLEVEDAMKKAAPELVLGTHKWKGIVQRDSAFHAQ